MTKNNKLFNLKRWGKIIPLGLTLCLFFWNKQKAQAQAYGDFPYFQSFTSGTQPTEVTKPNGAGTNDATFTTSGLRLTRAINSLFGAIFINDKQFTSSLGIKVSFEYSIYGGNGADGISMFLFDASVTNPVIGAKGGSLGYSYIRTNNDYSSLRKEGLTGAYLSVALDAYGNHKRMVFQSDGRDNGVTAPSGGWSQYESHVTLRGAKGVFIDNNGKGLGYTGYPVLKTQSTYSATSNASAELNTGTGAYTYGGGTSDNFDLKSGAFTIDPNNSAYRKAFIDLLPASGGGFYVTVKIQHQNTLTTIISNYYYPTSLKYTENANPAVTDFNSSNSQGANTVHTLNSTPPSYFRIGFAASTGGLNNIHLIRNLSVSLPYAAEAADDLGTTCRNVPVVIDPYANDIAYAGLILLTPVPTASKNNIDPSQFRFLNSDGTTAADPFSVTNSQGTFTYNATTKKVTFTPATGFIGTASINYNVKGITVPIVGGPYGDEAYRSSAATINVRVSKCQVITNPMLPTKSNNQ